MIMWVRASTQHCSGGILIFSVCVCVCLHTSVLSLDKLAFLAYRVFSFSVVFFFSACLTQMAEKFLVNTARPACCCQHKFYHTA